MGVNYGSSKIFDDYAGPLYNERHIRPGKVAPDATRLMFLQMYDGMMKQMGYAANSEQARENALDNLAAQYSPGRVGVDTDRYVAGLYNSSAGRENQAYQQALARGLPMEYAMALVNAARQGTKREANKFIGSEGQRRDEANSRYLDVLNQMQQMPFAQIGMGILSPNEEWRQMSQNRKSAGQASQGIGGALSSIGGLGGIGSVLSGIGSLNPRH